MMLRKRFISAVFFLLLASNGPGVHSAIENTTDVLRQAVETYCQIEFDGAWIEDRWGIVKFSAKRKSERELKIHTDAHIYQIKNYPFVVVSSYEIRDIRVIGPVRATAQVAYQRLARSETEADGRWHLVVDRYDNDVVTLNLVFEGGRWWVIDPPLPRLAKDVLIRHYETTIRDLEVENDPRWQKERDIIKLLKSL